MIYRVYSVRDSKSGFMTPTVDVNDDVAIRNFNHAVTQSEGILFTHAHDFSLYMIGTFDADHGILDPAIPPSCIAEGSDALRAVRQEVPKDA